MGKYASRQKKEHADITRKTVNPYMRGIGCIFMIIIPVFSYAAGSYIAGQNIGFGVLPPEWYAASRPIPDFAYQLSGIARNAINWLYNVNHLPATLAFGVIVLVVVGGFISIVYGYMYSWFAPSKYGPLDIPAPRVKTKKYKR